MRKNTNDFKEMALSAPAHETVPGFFTCVVGAEDSASETDTAPAADTVPAPLANINTVPVADTVPAPAADTNTIPVADNVPAPATNTNTASAALPEGYLTEGYFATTDKGAKYLRPEYVGIFAQQIAAALAPTMKPSDFASLLRGLKKSNKSVLPYEARNTAILELRPKVRSLVHRKRAPQILSDFIDVNIAAVQDDEKWTAFYRHCEAVQGFLYDTTD